LLEKSAAPVVVNVSSCVGSLHLASVPSSPWREANFPVYASSKAALNMHSIRHAAAFPRLRITSVDPGFTSTEFNHRATFWRVGWVVLVIVSISGVSALLVFSGR
jgi:NAD(P)-dependent dehydrogenase (short-subunit alcohol dehydrogenase family)